MENYEETKLTVTVPIDLKDYIKEQAELSDTTMSSYTVDMLRDAIKESRKRKAIELIQNIKPIKVKKNSEEVVREIRDNN